MTVRRTDVYQGLHREKRQIPDICRIRSNKMDKIISIDKIKISKPWMLILSILSKS
ncbi:MAG: hypothetical protein MZU97_07955 [Bacillus subtilis]|nr:hypothetical protein [Bacillus subtilis]